MTQKQAQAIADDMLEVGHFHFDGASWAFYEHILEQRGAGGHHARITYDRGQMEVLTGADVQGALDGILAEFLTGFEFQEEVSAASVSDLRVEDDIIYVISSGPVPDEPDRGVSGRDRSFELRVTRSRLVPKGGNLDGCAVEPGKLKLKGVVRAHVDGEVFVASPGSLKFPGIWIREHFDFVEIKKGGKKK